MTSAVDALIRRGGRASAGELLKLTTYRQLRAALEAGSVERFRRGHYGLPGQPPARAAALALDAVVSHLSAAEHWDLPVLTRPDVPHVTVPRHRKRRNGPPVSLHRADLAKSDLHGRVTSPLRTVLDCARTLPFAEALAIADGALREGLVGRAELESAAAIVRGPGRSAVLRAADHADGRAESCLESALRAVLVDAGIEGFEPQLQIDDNGFRARVDLGDMTARLLLEADSFEFHGKRADLVNDCWRYDELVARGWRVLRFSYEQIIGDPDWVVEMVLRALGGWPSAVARAA